MIARHVAATGGALIAATWVALGMAACSSSPTAPSSQISSAQPGVVSAVPDVVLRNGDGNTPFRLTEAGWNCLNVPGHGVHCEDPHAEIGSGVHIQVKVFDTADPSSDSAAFLGTESLVRADHYKGQPCLPGHGTYFLLPFGYYACHHFDF
jgi:hypothetical protein